MIIKYRLNKGFTLVELMITLVLSLTITYAIAQVLISSNRTSVTSDGMSQSQETGRFVIQYLANHIREAGLDSSNPNGNSRSTDAFISCSEFPALVDDANACIAENGGGEDENSIQDARIHGDRIAIARIVPAGSLADCTGSTVYLPTGAAATVPYAEDDLMINAFWVAFDNTNNLSNLMCQGFLFDGVDVVGSSPAQAIANGVEAMHILYGEATSALTPPQNLRNINRYVAAPANPAAPTANEVQNWSRVYAVKISVMTRSITDVTNSNILRRYVLANAAPYDMTDSVSRQVFTTTIVINNFR
jgi:type IV pilus assembly protein PilW